MPLALAALAAGAIIQFGLYLAPEWYSIFGPYLIVDPLEVIRALRDVVPFLLAAAVLVGADRWPAGRRWLLWAAALFGLLGLLGIGYGIWFAIWEASPGDIADGVQRLLAAGSVASMLCAIGASAGLSFGLWSARPPDAAGRTRLMWMAIAGLVGTIAFVSGAWVALTVYIPSGGVTEEPTYALFGLLLPFGATSFALVAITALRAMPARGRVPEILVASGAIVVAAGVAGEVALPWLPLSKDVMSEVSEAQFTALGAVTLLGFGAMIAGFAAGARGRHAPQVTEDLPA